MYKETLKEIIGALAIMAGTCVLIGIGAFGVLLLTAQSSKEIGKEVSTPYFDDYTEIIKSKTIKPVIELDIEIPLDLEAEGTVVKATWYSREGCINCHPELIMANGKPLDDNAYALAYDAVPLGTIVTICNMGETNCVDAEVTDRIGDPLHADLTPVLFAEFAPLSLGVIDRLILYNNQD